MINLLKEQKSYSEFVESITKLGYELVDELTDYLDKKQRKDFMHGFGCDGNNGYIMGEPTRGFSSDSYDEFGHLKNLSIYPKEQLLKNFFSITRYRQKIENRSFRCDFHPNYYNNFYFQIDIVSQNNEILDCIFSPFEKGTRWDNEVLKGTNDYVVYPHENNYGEVLTTSETIKVLHILLNKYEFHNYNKISNDFIKLTNMLELIKANGDLNYNKKNSFCMGYQHVPIIFGNDDISLTCYVDADYINLNIYHMEYTNHGLLANYIKENYNSLKTMKNKTSEDNLKLMGIN